MKKFLAMLLALCMIMGSIVIVSAEESEVVEHVENEIVLDAIKGDGNSGEYLENSGAIIDREMGAGTKGIAQCWYFSWFANDAKKGVEVPTYDITGMDYVEFEVYVSRADAMVGVPICFELTSGGTCDVQEDAFIKNADEWLLDKDGNYIKDGWNTVRVPLSLFPQAGADRTRINCFRMFNNGNVVINEDEWFVLMLKSFTFGTEAEGTKISIPFDSEIGVGGGVMLDYNSSNTTKLPAGKVNPGQWMAMYQNIEPMDLSTYKYVDISMKITNVEEFKKIKWEIELTSSGKPDAQESNYTGFFDDVSEGWNTIRVPLSAFTFGGKACDLSKVNFVRMYSIGTEDRTLASDVTIEFTNFTFSDAGNVNWQEYSFTAAKGGELPANIKQLSETFGDNGNDCVFADITHEIVYEVTLDYIPVSAMYITLTPAGRDLLLQVGNKNSADSYKNVFDASSEKGLPPVSAPYVINVADYIGLDTITSGGYRFYLRVADTVTSDGGGGQIKKSSPVIFSVAYSAWEVDESVHVVTPEDIAADEAEMLADEHSVPLFGCNAALAEYKIDYDDKKSGASSLYYKLGTWTEVDKTTGEEVEYEQKGTSGFQFTTEKYAGEKSVDASGMDTLEFWFWVSDIDALMAAGFADTGLELTSSGSCDQEEVCWRLIEHIMPQVTENSTWTKIRLPLSSGAKSGDGGCDMSRLNYMRFFFVNAQNLPEEPVIIKIDDIRLTDYEAQAIAAETPAAEAMAAKITEKLGNIPEWDDENADVIAQYDANAATWAADYEALKAELDAMSDIAQGIVSDLGAKKLVTNVKRWLDRYDKYEPAPAEDPTETPTEDPTETPTEDPTEEPTETPTEDPTEEPKEGGNTVVIIIIVVVVVVAAAAVAFIVIKKKKA